MADDNAATAAKRAGNHRKGRRLRLRRLRRRHKIKGGGVDSISSLPDVILQHILCLVPTKLAIRTSLLSKRWRHVWCNTPYLSFSDYETTYAAASINETLTRYYTAPKMIDFHLFSSIKLNVLHINPLIELALSRNVENLSLDYWGPSSHEYYKFPDSFYINSSFKKLILGLNGCNLTPPCSVTWTSLKKLSLCGFTLSGESLAKVLSGCYVLESLTLYNCYHLEILDLSGSLSLRTLKINQNWWDRRLIHIVAPHICFLRFRNSQVPCILDDVSSLTEAKVDIYNSSCAETPSQDMVLKMLDKLQNAEKLTFGANFLQILSLAEICDLPFPMLKVKDLTLETSISRYVIPGIERMLQNSPDLKKLTIHTRNCNVALEGYLDKYLTLQGLNPVQCWRSKDGVIWNKYRSKLKTIHVTSFMELVLKNTKTLEKIVVLLEEPYLKFKELVERTLSQNDIFSIVLSMSPFC